MLYVMLVGAYPFERPEDKTDTQKLQKMIQVSYGPYCWRVSLSMLQAAAGIYSMLVLATCSSCFLRPACFRGSSRRPQGLQM